MCFSAEASFAAAALLVPAGAIGIRRAYQSDRRYLAFAALPVYFGLQQLFEGLVWTGGRLGNEVWIENFSLVICSSHGWRGQFGCRFRRIS